MRRANVEEDMRMTKKEEDTWGKEEMRTRGGHEEEMSK